MAVSMQASEALSELMRSEGNVVGFSEDLHEGGVLRVYVQDIALTDLLPKAVAGHAVQYVEVGVQQKISSPAVVDLNPRTRARPLVGGVSISPDTTKSAGTLGYFAASDNKMGLLTCAHVLPKVGQRVIQQGGLDGGTDADFVATVVASVDDGQRVDCAFAAIDKTVQCTLEINAIGRVPGARLAERAEQVCKSGRTTKLTTGGEITDVNATITIGPNVYKGQILVKSSAQFANSGDSGSLLIAEKDTAVVGLVMSTNVPQGTTTFANQIGEVEKALGVRLA